MFLSPELVAAIEADRRRDADRRHLIRLTRIARDCCRAATATLRPRLFGGFRSAPVSCCTAVR